jgi:hypothetical protein
VHVAATADGSTIALYVNGHLAGAAQQQISPHVGNYSVTIDGANVVPGIVDEVMVWDNALTATDIAAVYDAGASGVCP